MNLLIHNQHNTCKQRLRHSTNWPGLLAGTLACCAQLASGQPGDNILVTAERITVDASTVPMTFANVGTEELELTGAIHINEIMQRVPGAWISRGNGQESLAALRSPVLTGAGGCGSFYMAFDSISLRAPGFCNVNQLFDANIEQAGRIEVIKGPATALYGSNAMHGVINILSAAPGDIPDQELALEAGSYDYYRARYHYRNTRGAHGVSINLNGSSDGGYQHDSGYDQQKLTLRHDYRGSSWDITSAVTGNNLNQETAGFIEGYQTYADDERKRTNPNPEAYRDAWSWLAYSSASKSFNDQLSITLTPYIRDNSMAFLQHFLPWKAVEENGHRSAGLRSVLQIQAENWRWLNGIDVEYTDGWLRETQREEFSPNQPAGRHYDYEVAATLAAAYSQYTVDLGEHWQLAAGIRGEYTGYDYDNRLSDGSACAASASACRFYRPADRRDSFGDWSLNLGLSYLLDDNNTIYLRTASGFRAPETSELYRLQSGQLTAGLDSEEVTNLELGWRSALGERLAFSIAAYQMNKRNVIFQDADRFNVSGARTSHQGLELALDYRLGQHWYAGLDLTAARHRYDSNDPLLGVGSNIKGNDIDTAPRLFGSARLGWQAVSKQQAGAELEWVYMDDYYLEPENIAQYKGHSLLNLRLYSTVGPRLSASLRLTNLLDEDYAERADFGFGEYRYFVGRPRSAFLELRYQLGPR